MIMIDLSLNKYSDCFYLRMCLLLHDGNAEQ